MGRTEGWEECAHRVVTAPPRGLARTVGYAAPLPFRRRCEKAIHASRNGPGFHRSVHCPICVARKTSRRPHHVFTRAARLEIKELIPFRRVGPGLSARGTRR